MSKSLLAPRQDMGGASSGDAGLKLAVVTSGGRPALSVPPTSDAGALLGLDVACHDGEACQFLAALRLALLASKRSPTARVLAFLASQAALPAEQCRQLSGSFAAARVALDVVLLAGEGEVPPDAMATLQLLTAASASASHSAHSDAPASTSTSSSVPAAAADAAADVAAGQRLLVFPPPDPSLALWQQLESLLELLQPEGGAHGPADHHHPTQAHAHAEEPPPPPLLPPQPASASAAGAPDGGRPHRESPSAAGVAEAGSSAEAQSGGSAAAPSRPYSGRPPLPRPPRHRTSGPGAAAMARSAAAAPSAAAAGAQRGGLAPSGPLVGRSGARRGGVAVGGCRYESLDSLQHLSSDGFLRSWLPSYANISRVVPPSLLPPSNAPSLCPTSRPQPDGRTDGEGAAGPAAAGAAGEAGPAPWLLPPEGPSGRSGGGGGPAAGQLCYVSVYRLQLPRWHKVLEVHAGCCVETAEMLEGAAAPGPSHAAAAAPAAAGTREEAETGAPHPAVDGTVAMAGPTSHAASDAPGPSASAAAAAPAAAAAGASQAAPPRNPPPPPAAARPAVAVPRAPCPVAVNFSTRCSSAAAAAASASAAAASDSGGGGAAATCSRTRWVVPDPRRGSLSLIVSVEDPGVVKLCWSERPRPEGAPGPGGPGQQRQYGSIFPTAEEGCDGGVDPAAAELELTLSPTRTQFSVVAAASGGAVLEVLSPRSAVHRPRQPPHDAAPGSGSPSGAGPQPHGSSSPRHHADAGAGAPHPAGAGSCEPGHPHGPGHPPQPPQQRYFFWLQQDWAPPRGEGTVADLDLDPAAAAAAAASVSADRDPRRGVRGVRALVSHLQALLECPPEFDHTKHGNRVRCSNTPLQLGPLPLSLVDEIMRASGRRRGPDGTVTTLALAAAAAARGSRGGAGELRRRQQQGVGGGGADGAAAGDGGSAAAAATGTAATATSSAGKRAGAGRLSGAAAAADGMCSLALSRSPTGTAGVSPPPSQLRGPTARGAPRDAASDAPHNPHAAGSSVAASTSTGAAEAVRGFRRTTYSRAAPSPAHDTAASASPPGPAAAPTGAGPARRTGAASHCGGVAPAAAAAAPAAAVVLRSHPLDVGLSESLSDGDELSSADDGIDDGDPADMDMDIDMDIDVCPAAPAAPDCEPGPQTPPPSCTDAGGAPDADDDSPSHGHARAGGATPAAAATSPAAAAAVAATAAAAAVAAVRAEHVAAVAAASAASPLVAAVDADGGGACQEEGSLLFDLD